MSNIAVIGRTSVLAQCLHKKLLIAHDVILFGRSDFDFADPDSVHRLGTSLANFDLIINCAGLLTGTVSQMYSVNTTGPITLLHRLQQLGCRARVIMIGSHGAMWPSWPGAEKSRILYNCTKLALQDFIVSFSHARCSEMQLCLFNASRFKSPMSGGTGHDVNTVAQQICDIIQWPSLSIKIEMESPDARPST